jgi:hypothetical protein
MASVNHWKMSVLLLFFLSAAPFKGLVLSLFFLSQAELWLLSVMLADLSRAAGSVVMTDR